MTAVDYTGHVPAMDFDAIVAAEFAAVNASVARIAEHAPDVATIALVALDDDPRVTPAVAAGYVAALDLPPEVESARADVLGALAVLEALPRVFDPDLFAMGLAVGAQMERERSASLRALGALTGEMHRRAGGAR